MNSPIPFNEPCRCGSGELYRDCCGRNILLKRRQRRNIAIGLIIVIAALIPVLVRMYRLDQEKRQTLTLPPGSYYSEVHKHWHDANGQEIVIPGYIWSSIQDRWIKVTDSLIEQLKAEEARGQTSHNRPPGAQQPQTQQAPGVPHPQQEPPPGQVWSEEHGHFHDEKNV